MVKVTELLLQSPGKERGLFDYLFEQVESLLFL